MIVTPFESSGCEIKNHINPAKDDAIINVKRVDARISEFVLFLDNDFIEWTIPITIPANMIREGKVEVRFTRPRYGVIPDLFVASPNSVFSLTKTKYPQ